VYITFKKSTLYLQSALEYQHVNDDKPHMLVHLYAQARPSYFFKMDQIDCLRVWKIELIVSLARWQRKLGSN
ncbi:MAG: hypothetical protein ACJAVV_002925, partial [Alphaproteobacteria bacterium]